MVPGGFASSIVKCKWLFFALDREIKQTGPKLLHEDFIFKTNKIDLIEPFFQNDSVPVCLTLMQCGRSPNKDGVPPRCLWLDELNCRKTFNDPMKPSANNSTGFYQIETGDHSWINQSPTDLISSALFFWPSSPFFIEFNWHHLFCHFVAVVADFHLVCSGVCCSSVLVCSLFHFSSLFWFVNFKIGLRMDKESKF